MKRLDKNRNKVTQAAQLIEENLHRNLKITDIANHVHLSPFHFQRLFFAYMGEPVNRYIAVRRLETAALELTNTPNINLLQLAINCGFQTHSAFSRAFKKQFGISPSAFRNSPEAAETGVQQGRPYLINQPPRQVIEPVEIVTLRPFYFRFQQSRGTYEGQFFHKSDLDIGAYFLALLKETVPPDQFLMSCFPNTPQMLNDDTVTVWYGGAYSERPNNNKSYNWHMFDAGTWAVFEHWGDYKFLYQTWNQIYRNWLAQTAYRLRDEFPFEAYSGTPNYIDPAKQLTRIYIPLRKA
ncbi:helix-turn-helix domain-containing protein [Microbulbifer sp. PSTR4-B]|uniref:helix-turn-helix domain-containing protein n=1 Tax=Microbulbifer sp. PSTR4-B TaxID=3243396 RepID=UPI00403A2391